MLKIGLSVSVVLVFLAVALIADVPSLFNYSGRLVDEVGQPFSDGDYELEFRIWNSSLNGELLWGRKLGVTLRNGHFHMLLGNSLGTALPNTNFSLISEAFSVPDTYIGLTIVTLPDGRTPTSSELLPRQRVSSTAYAFQADRAEHAERADEADRAKEVEHDLAIYVEESEEVGGLQNVQGWNDRNLNVTRFPVAPDPNSSIARSGRLITLQPGIYKIIASAPAHRVDFNQACLFDAETGEILITGTSEHAHAEWRGSTRSLIEGIVEVVEEPKVVEIKHWTRRIYVVGLGVSTTQNGVGPGTKDIYTTITIERISDS